ncbi:MAG: hypothetical protein WCC21_14695 [Candidatus Acidiferrales bacterium]
MPENPAAVPHRQLLRHAVATVAYRGGKALHGAPDGFAEFRAGEESRTPGEILAHISDVLEWGLTLAKGSEKYHVSDSLPWDKASQRFFASLEALDTYLASEGPLACSPEKLMQAPIADALTHVGQIAMLRRLAGGPIRPENYYLAEIVAGRAGAQQARPKLEFD